MGQSVAGEQFHFLILCTPGEETCAVMLLCCMGCCARVTIMAHVYQHHYATLPSPSSTPSTSHPSHQAQSHHHHLYLTTTRPTILHTPPDSSNSLKPQRHNQQMIPSPKRQSGKKRKRPERGINMARYYLSTHAPAHDSET